MFRRRIRLRRRWLRGGRLRSRPGSRLLRFGLLLVLLLHVVTDRASCGSADQPVVTGDVAAHHWHA